MCTLTHLHHEPLQFWNWALPLQFWLLSAYINNNMPCEILSSSPFSFPSPSFHSSPFDHYYSFSLMARGEKPNGTYLPPPVNLPPRSNRPPLPDREHRSVGARSEAPQRSAIPPYISPLPLDGMSVCVIWMYLCVCARECWSAMTWLWINPILTKSYKIPWNPHHSLLTQGSALIFRQRISPMFRRQRFLRTQVLWITAGPAHKSCINMKQFLLFLDSGLKIEYI